MKRLVIIASHPIQYYAPWFRYLHQQTELQIEVLYLWNPRGGNHFDQDFNQTVEWDVDLLSGYPHRFIENISPKPGTHYWYGLNNPTLFSTVVSLRPTAVLMTTLFNYSATQFLSRWSFGRFSRAPIFFRGDSHLLSPNAKYFKENIKYFLKCQIFKQFDAILPVGTANENYYLNHGAKKNCLFPSPHAIDAIRFMEAKPQAEVHARNWRNKLGISENAFVFLFVGKLINKKRPDLLLSAFLNVHSKLSEKQKADCHLVLCGTGELEAEMRRLANHHSAIHFLGFANQQSMPAVYCLGTMLVLPSEGNSETWGLCVNEAMTMNRPALVSTHVGCQQDLVEHRVTGLVFPAGDQQALEVQMMYALSNKEIVNQLASASGKRISKFTYKQATAGLLNALKFVKASKVK